MLSYKAGDNGVDFYYLFSIVDYDELPIVFVSEDKDENYYLCDCTEFRFSKQRWAIAPTTVDIITEVIRGEKSVYSALKEGSRLFLVECDLETDIFTQKEAVFEQTPKALLPVEDSFLLNTTEDALIKLLQLITEKASVYSSAVSCACEKESFVDEKYDVK